MRVLGYILKRWRQWWGSGVEPSEKIDVRKWAEQVKSLNQTTYKHH